MKTTDRPFEGILGNTVELRIIEKLIAMPDAEFNVTELGNMSGVHRDSASKVIEKFLRWNIIQKVSRRGNMDLFQLNSDEPLVISMNTFNDSIIMQMFPEVEEALEDMALEPIIAPGKTNERRGPFVSTTSDCANVIQPYAEGTPSIAFTRA